MRTALTLLAAATLLAGCATSPAPPPPARAPLKLTILHTNDHHGRFWPNAQGEYGMAARKTIVDRVRAEVAAAGGHVLFLDGGDVNTGVPESDLQDAEPDFLGMNRLGIDAMAVGNHEFDKPPAVLARQRQWAKFPLLSANIYQRTPQGLQRMFPPYTVFERGGYRIAVMGLTTDDTAKMVLPAHVEGIEFRKPIDEAARLLPELRARADMVIAVTHMGHYPNGSRGVNAPGDVEMARALPPGQGPDLIVGGHSQNPVCMLAENRRNPSYVPGEPCAPDRQNGTWIVQAHEWGKYVGRADFEVSAGRVELVRYQLIPVNLLRRGADGKPVLAGERVPEDAAMQGFLKPYQDIGQSRLLVPVGSAEGVLDGDRDRVRRQPTTLGTLLARAMRSRTGADLALMNSGGIRDSLPAGPLTYRDLLKVQPFGNTISVVRLSGEELLGFLRAAAKMTPGAGGFAQTAGVRLRIVAGELELAEVNGRPIDPQASYLLAINNFTATGGDGYPRLDQHPGHVNTGLVDVEVLREFVARNSPLRPADFEPGDAVIRK
ncbi:MAG: bifunctional UDP-sugar hydrolase/5'-nucleotidase [Rubrivivax sp.]|nr:bifunctional UDP-sugar hydrolase/5'-nucleotidase [Rubrivivax sp.]